MNKRKMLIALPCLIPSGGINVIIGLLKVLQKMDYQVDILSREDGYMHKTFSEMGAKIRIESNILEENLCGWILGNYDEVLVNTLQMCGLIYRLNGKNIEVKWWIHEPPLFFEKYQDMVPKKFWNQLEDNIRILAAGNIVHEHLLRVYGKENDLLNFGVEDIADQIADVKMDIVSPDKITFLLPSIIFQYIKGQDLLAMAIADLPEEYGARTEFIFVGSVLEEMESYYEILSILEKEKQNVKILDIMEKDKLLSLMKQADCIVAPSREDATNSCIVEGMMLSKVCLCSDATGVSRYMEDCVNGFVFPNCNVDELKARIMLIADNFGKLDVIARNGRKVYEEVFSMKVFEENVRKYWKEVRKQ